MFQKHFAETAMSNETTTQDQEVISLVERLKNRSIGFYAVPQEYRYHPSVVAAERELGLRRSIRKGYDIIRNNFFVDECVGGIDCIAEDELTVCFDDFSAYYDFLRGDIYDNACYTHAAKRLVCRSQTAEWLCLC